MDWKLISGDPSPRMVRKLVRALYQGAKNVNPSAEDYQRWANAVRNGTPLAEIVATVVAEVEREWVEKRKTAQAVPLAAEPPQAQGAEIPLFVPPGHFYSPVVDPKEGAEAWERVARGPWPASLPGIAIDRQAMVATWRELVPLFETSGMEAKPAPGFRYGYENDHYGWGDGSLLSAMIRKFRPSKIIEIGSGWSSACTLDTLDRNPDIRCEVTFIEPYPQLLKERLGAAYANHRVFAEPVQNVDPELFGTLGAGDFLFIDSTHVVKTGSDVCFELFEILPRLKSGVLVHVHDIFWPFEYPRDWIVDENRSWNELYAYRALLTHSPDWEILMFNGYMAKLERDLMMSTWRPFLNNSGCAMWMRKR